MQFNDSSHNPNAITDNKDFPKDRRFIQEIEKAVLCLSENQIAVKLYKLPDTIKFCKHKLFDKLKVVDIAEAYLTQLLITYSNDTRPMPSIDMSYTCAPLLYE